MRSDVKIGIAVGLLVVVVGLVWFVFLDTKPDALEAGVGGTVTVPDFDPPEQDPPPPRITHTPSTGSAGTETALPSATTGTAESSPLAPGPSAPVVIGEPSGPTGPVVGSTGSGLLPSAGRGESLPSYEGAGTALTPSTTRRGSGGSLTRTAYTEEPSYLSTPPGTAGGGGRIGERVGGTSSTVSRGGTASAPAGQMRIYIVTAQDTGGLWGIAKREYGAGKYLTLIEDANPGVNSNTLRPGQELKLPPRPVESQETGQAASSTGPPAGAPAGSDTYVVQEGDSYWKIAAAKYGDGLFHYVLEEANHVGANDLRPGMVLIVPPKPATRPGGGETATSSSGAATTGGATIVAGPGERVYTIVSGDSYWKVARKMYNNEGRLWPAIQEANPDVLPLKMQAGRQLLIPSIETARSAIGLSESGSAGSSSGSSGESSGSSDAERTGRPVFH